MTASGVKRLAESAVALYLAAHGFGVAAGAGASVPEIAATLMDAALGWLRSRLA
jgi:hypothetical protein